MNENGHRVILPSLEGRSRRQKYARFADGRMARLVIVRQASVGATSCARAWGIVALALMEADVTGVANG